MNINAGEIKLFKKKRSCLLCGKLFLSDGSFNRRCKSCAKLVVLRRKDYFEDPYMHKVSHGNEVEALDYSFTINSID